jgi:hypothetical protein
VKRMSFFKRALVRKTMAMVASPARPSSTVASPARPSSRPTSYLEEADFSPAPSVMTSYVGSPEASPLPPPTAAQLQARLLPQLAPSPTKRLLAATHVIIKGARSRLCFGRNTAVAQVNILPPVIQESEALWSPAAVASSTGWRGNGGRQGADGRAHEIVVPRALFEEPPPAAADQEQRSSGGRGGGLFGWSRSAHRSPAAPDKPKSPIPSCCICLEDLEVHNARSAPMRCSQCTMQAHPTCLSKWFEAESTKATPRPPQNNTRPQQGTAPPSLPKSTASCPSCRCELDWDALALQARRTRAPLSMPLARPSEFFTKPSPPPPSATRLQSPRVRSVGLASTPVFTTADASSSSSSSSHGVRAAGAEAAVAATEAAAARAAAAAIAVAPLRLAPTRRSGLVHAGSSGSQSARSHSNGSSLLSAITGGLTGGHAMVLRSARGSGGSRRPAAAPEAEADFNDMWAGA